MSNITGSPTKQLHKNPEVADLYSDFSMAGELATYNSTAKRSPSLIIQKIIYSESVPRPAAYLLLRYAPTSKIIFT